MGGVRSAHEMGESHMRLRLMFAPQAPRMRNTLALLASAMLGTGLVATPGVATAEPAPPSINWQPCGDDAPGVDCATIEVPLDYKRPHGAQIHIGLAKRPATDPSKRIGSLL